MLYYLLSIAILTVLFLGLNKTRIVSVCPICAGVLIAWIGSIIALYYGATFANPLIIAILMGASLGALADKYGNKYGLLWKSALVIFGLPAIYFIVQKSIGKGLIFALAIAVVTILSNKKSSSGVNHKKDLFQDCC